MTVKELINELEKVNEDWTPRLVCEFDGGCAYELEEIHHLEISSTYKTIYLVGETLK